MNIITKVFDRRKSKFKYITLFVLILCTGGILILNYCSRRTWPWNGSSSEVTTIGVPDPISDKPSNPLPFYNGVSTSNFSLADLDKRFKFYAEKDVFIFVHIQKTGGTTFGKHLVKDSNFKDASCRCYVNKRRCKCRTSKGYQWLFSRLSTGWTCGLHADWTELKGCAVQFLDEHDGFVRERRYLYMTILREPVLRYISEWRQVQRGGTWVDASLRCGGRNASRREVPLCYKGRDWSNVSFDGFASCAHNLAHNRQTRMVSDLQLVGCYDKSVLPDDKLRGAIMLQSAKQNLNDMAFFGLTEFQTDTQFLFEHTFGLRFSHNFSQNNATHANRADLTSSQMDLLLQRNQLDLQFYAYAKELFLARVKYARMKQREMSESRSQTNVIYESSFEGGESKIVKNSLENTLCLSINGTKHCSTNEEVDDDQIVAAEGDPEIVPKAGRNGEAGDNMVYSPSIALTSEQVGEGYNPLESYPDKNDYHRKEEDSDGGKVARRTATHPPF